MIRHDFINNPAQLKTVLLSIKPDVHIIGGRRGSEENVKIKIILPLIEYLGYDLINDADFELYGADIVLSKNNNPVLIIETKAWDELVTDHLNQCLEYMFKLKVPIIMVTSGQCFSLYTALGNLEGLNGADPIIKFTFNDLIGDGSEELLLTLKSLIGKNELSDIREVINKKILSRFAEDKALAITNEFFDKCSSYVTVIKAKKINEDEFEMVAGIHGEEIKQLFLWCRDQFKRIAKENDIIYKYSSKSIGLKYLYTKQARPKILGLVGLYPEKSKIAFGKENWIKLNCPEEYLKRINSFSSQLKSKDQAEDLVSLVGKALKEVLKQ